MKTENSMKEDDPFTFDVDTISKIEPKYVFERDADGKFEVYIDNDLSCTICFGSFLDYRLQLDRKDNNGELFTFLMNNYHKKSVSHAICDLYDIGFPIDEWVKDYIQHLTNKNSKYAAMFLLLNTLKNFGTDYDDLDTGSII